MVEQDCAGVHTDSNPGQNVATLTCAGDKGHNLARCTNGAMEAVTIRRTNQTYVTSENGNAVMSRDVSKTTREHVVTSVFENADEKCDVCREENGTSFIENAVESRDQSKNIRDHVTASVDENAADEICDVCLLVKDRVTSVEGNRDAEAVDVEATKLLDLPVQNEDIFSEMDHGWAWVILLVSFGTNALVSLAFNAGGIMYLALVDIHSDESVALTAFTGVLQSAMSSIAAPLASVLTDVYSCRVTIMLAGVLYTLGNLLTAFAPNIHTVIFTFGILSGTGSALGYTASNVVLSYNFKVRRNLSLAICAMGGGTGLFLFPPLLQVSRDYYGSRGMFIIFAAIVANMTVFGALCTPSKMEIYCKKQRKRRAAVVTTKHRSNKKRFSILKTYMKVLGQRQIVLLCMSTFGFYLSLFTVSLYLPAFVVSTGFSELHASMLISLIGALSIVGRLLTGIIANMNCVDDLFLHSGSIAIISATILIYAFASGYAFTHIVLAVIIGLLFGTSFILATSVSLPFVGVDFISVTLGVELFFGGLGSVIGPIITGSIIDSGGTYRQCFLLTGSVGAMAAVLSAMTGCWKKQKDPLVMELK